MNEVIEREADLLIDVGDAQEREQATSFWLI
jgi:hypothetical protein